VTELKYDRQTRIPDWDQAKLENAIVAVVGAGALGNHVCLGLIGLGIGTIKIYDYDEIEPHNLNRQSLFTEVDIGSSKAESLAARLSERNTSINVVGIEEKIEEETVADIIGTVDLVIDCVDRIYVRRILNRYCLERDIPLIHGGISWIGGQVGVLTRHTPCINCIFPGDLQKTELEEETSCTRKPESSVVYTSQVVAGFMVKYTREVLLPLTEDPKYPPGLFKIDFRLHPPFYFERIHRKAECECVEILQRVAPDILKEEQSLNMQVQKEDDKEILKILHEKTPSKKKSTKKKAKKTSPKKKTSKPKKITKKKTSKPKKTIHK
jgi:adenylyltransferase/sulfurtransferase